MEIERQLKFNYSFKFPFSVICQLDLNHEGADIRKPLRGEISKKFYLGRETTALSVTAEIPFRGFVGGQTLTVFVNIVNGSSVVVETMIVELRKLCSLNANNGSYTSTEILMELSQAGVAAGTNGEAVFCLAIPPVEPTSVRFSKYVHITYEVVVVARVSGWHRNLELRVPITIGTIPISDMEGASTSTSMAQSFQTASDPPDYEHAINADEMVKVGKH